MVTTQPKRLIVTAEEARRLHAGETVDVWRPIARVARIGPVTEFQRSGTPGYDWTFRDRHKRWHDLREVDLLGRFCPFPIGSRWWVAETWVQLLAVSPSSDQPLKITDGERLIEPPTSWVDGQGRTRWNYDGIVIAYRANSKIEFCDGDGLTGEFADRSDMPRWCSPATMPRWASRTLAESTACRVELRKGVWHWVANMRGEKA